MHVTATLCCNNNIYLFHTAHADVTQINCDNVTYRLSYLPTFTLNSCIHSKWKVNPQLIAMLAGMTSGYEYSAYETSVCCD